MRSPFVRTDGPAALAQASAGFEVEGHAYEKLRDPSHGRCLSLTEWSAMLTRTGFAGIRSERMDQDIAFEPWTQRMRCDVPTIVHICGNVKSLGGALATLSAQAVSIDSMTEATA